MAIGLMGRKRGMLRIFSDDGSAVPVTVIEVQKNRAAQVRDAVRDGYRAVQLTAGSVRSSKLSRSQAGHFASKNVEAGRTTREFRLGDSEQVEVGAEFGVEVFQVGQMVDVEGVTKGKGFQGTIKRHHFAGQDRSHGNSLSHRVPGSIGQRQTPGRVFKGKRMSGHMGAVRRTVQNLPVVRVDVERNLLMVRGAIPGANGQDVVVTPAVKARG